MPHSFSQRDHGPQTAQPWLPFLPAPQLTYLKLGQLLTMVEDAEGIQVVRTRVWKHFTAQQTKGLLGHLAPVPVLVEVQVTVPHEAPT